MAGRPTSLEIRRWSRLISARTMLEISGWLADGRSSQSVRRLVGLWRCSSLAWCGYRGKGRRDRLPDRVERGGQDDAAADAVWYGKGHRRNDPVCGPECA